MFIYSLRINPTMVAAFLVLVGVSWTGGAQTATAPIPGLEPAIESSTGESSAASPRLRAALPDAATTDGTRIRRAAELASPPSPLQTAGALAGALIAILLAIAGVTLTFRSMRNEMRRGRGRSRRSPGSERTTLHQI